MKQGKNGIYRITLSASGDFNTISAMDKRTTNIIVKLGGELIPGYKPPKSREVRYEEIYLFEGKENTSIIKFREESGKENRGRLEVNVSSKNEEFVLLSSKELTKDSKELEITDKVNFD